LSNLERVEERSLETVEIKLLRGNEFIPDPARRSNSGAILENQQHKESRTDAYF
jgi:hypothetical protein